MHSEKEYSEDPCPILLENLLLDVLVEPDELVVILLARMNFDILVGQEIHLVTEIHRVVMF